MRTEIPIPSERLDEFCRDLDLLVTFAPEADPSLLDHVAMEEELADWIRRKAILEGAEPWPY